MSLLVSVLPAPDSPVTCGGRRRSRGRSRGRGAHVLGEEWEEGGREGQLGVCHTNLGCCLLLLPAGGSAPLCCSPVWPVPCPLSASSCTRHWQWHTRVAAGPGHHHCCKHPSPASHTALPGSKATDTHKQALGGIAVRKENLHSLLNCGPPHRPCCCCRCLSPGSALKGLTAIRMLPV